MSNTWYPLIDYEKCGECGICTNKCKNGVYDQKKAPTPVVVIPKNCIHGCHGCGNLCPTKAITYVGDCNSNSDGGKRKIKLSVKKQSSNCGSVGDDNTGGCC